MRARESKRVRSKRNEKKPQVCIYRRVRWNARGSKKRLQLGLPIFLRVSRHQRMNIRAEIREQINFAPSTFAKTHLPNSANFYHLFSSWREFCSRNSVAGWKKFGGLLLLSIGPFFNSKDIPKAVTRMQRERKMGEGAGVSKKVLGWFTATLWAYL